MGIVAFDFKKFITRYPEFQTLPPATADMYFSEATMYLNNTDSSLVTDTGQRSILLNMIVAHIAALDFGVNGESAPQTVGRVDQAAEGSVSVHLDMGAQPGSAAWWQQTKYGAAYWTATRSYRTMRYYPNKSRAQRWPR